MWVQDVWGVWDMHVDGATGQAAAVWPSGGWRIYAPYAGRAGGISGSEVSVQAAKAAVEAELWARAAEGLVRR